MNEGNIRTDIKKAASGTCGHFVVNNIILRSFLIRYPVLLNVDGGTSVDVWEWILEKGDLRYKDGEW